VGEGVAVAQAGQDELVGGVAGEGHGQGSSRRARGPREVTRRRRGVEAAVMMDRLQGVFGCQNGNVHGNGGIGV
jgi:hypothetical protein